MLKSLILFFAVTGTVSLSALPTREEIIEELALIRTSNPQFNDGIDPTAAYYLERVNEAKVLDATASRWEYLKKYVTMYWPVNLVRNLFGAMILLTKDNAPKTYEFIEATAQKMGMTEVPLVYFMMYEKLFNAFAAGYLHSCSIVCLGEKMIKDLPDTEALEFLIAHELSHIQKYHLAKRWVLLKITTNTLDALFKYYQVSEESSYNPIMRDANNPLVISLNDKIQPFFNFLIKAWTIALIQAFYSRISERDADVTAAHIVGARGGVKLFSLYKEKFEHAERDYAILQAELAKTSLKDSRWFQVRIATFKMWDAILEFLKKPFKTHPEHDERIAYLEELQKEQEKAGIFVA